MSKSADSMIPKPTKEVKVIPKDLQDRWASITATATACNCLDAGAYSHKYATVVRNSIAYLAKLHETLIEDALKHPQAHMISELKEIQKEINKAKKEAKENGQEKTAAAADAVIGTVEPESTDYPIHPAAGPISQ